MRCLVTGGAGFIGSNFINHMLNAKNAKILNFDKLTYAGNLMNLKKIEANPDYSFIRGDICDKETISRVFDKFKPEYIINFAAESHVDRSIIDADKFVLTNVLGTQNLLKASLDIGVKKFLQVSTDEVYGSLGANGCFGEETPLNPHSPYSASKAGADMLVKAYHDTYNMPVVITRSSNNYGPYQFPEKLIPLVIANCMSGKKIPVYGKGQNVRDWIYVEDHCIALENVLYEGREGEIYNIGGKNERRNIDVVKLIIKIISKLLPEKDISTDMIQYVVDRKGHDFRYALKISKIKREIGWTPSVKFEEGLKRTITWYIENQQWIRSVINKEYLNHYHRNYSSRGILK